MSDLHAGSIHDLRGDAFNYVWDNSIEPALELDAGDVVELHVRDASDEQIHAGSGVEDVEKLDFSHVNPVSGPLFVKGARPGDVLVVELLEFKPREWGWTAIIPEFGLLADEYPDPWLRISMLDAAAGLVRFAEGIALPYRPFPGTIGVAPAEPGEHSTVPPSRWGETWTRSTFAQARRSSCPSVSKARSCPLETLTLRRETVRCAALRSRRRWTSSFD